MVLAVVHERQDLEQGRTWPSRLIVANTSGKSTNVVLLHSRCPTLFRFSCGSRQGPFCLFFRARRLIVSCTSKFKGVRMVVCLLRASSGRAVHLFFYPGDNDLTSAFLVCSSVRVRVDSLWQDIDKGSLTQMLRAMQLQGITRYRFSLETNLQACLRRRRPILLSCQRLQLCVDPSSSRIDFRPQWVNMGEH